MHCKGIKRGNNLGFVPAYTEQDYNRSSSAVNRFNHSGHREGTANTAMLLIIREGLHTSTSARPVNTSSAHLCVTLRPLRLTLQPESWKNQPSTVIEAFLFTAEGTEVRGVTQRMAGSLI